MPCWPLTRLPHAYWMGRCAHLTRLVPQHNRSLGLPSVLTQGHETEPAATMEHVRSAVYRTTTAHASADTAVGARTTFGEACTRLTTGGQSGWRLRVRRG